MEGDEAVEFVRQMRAPLRQATAEGGFRQIEGVGEMVHAGQLRAVELAVVHHAADGNAAEAHAVVAALATDEAGARAFTADAMVGQRNLQGRVHSLAAGVHEERVVHAFRGQFHQRVGGLEAEWVTHLERRRIVHLGNLRGYGLADFLAAMAGIHAPQARNAVENFAAVLGPVVHAAALRQQTRGSLVLAVGGEGHPQRLHVLTGQRLLGKFDGIGAHGGVLGKAGRGGPVKGKAMEWMIRKIDTECDFLTKKPLRV